ncbi:hypothetical protein DAPPUDRAFT_333781, partial [Daphnia pulex]
MYYVCQECHNAKVGPNRWRFLIQSLQDLNDNLKKIGSCLFLLKESPTEMFKKYFKEWNIKKLTLRISQDVLELLENNPKSMGPMKNNEHPLLIEKNVMKPADNVKNCETVVTDPGDKSKSRLIFAGRQVIEEQSTYEALFTEQQFEEERKEYYEEYAVNPALAFPRPIYDSAFDENASQ